MNAALPAAMVDDYEDLIADQDLPDPDDHHVLAAALKAEAGFIVTGNLDDFPADKVPDRVMVASPDDFVTMLVTEDPDSVVDVVETQASSLMNPPMMTIELLDGLEEVSLVQAVARIRSAIS